MQNCHGNVVYVNIYLKNKNHWVVILFQYLGFRSSKRNGNSARVMIAKYFALMIKPRPSSGLVYQPANTREHGETGRWSQLMIQQQWEDLGGKLDQVVKVGSVS